MLSICRPNCDETLLQTAHSAVSEAEMILPTNQSLNRSRGCFQHYSVERLSTEVATFYQKFSLQFESNMFHSVTTIDNNGIT